MRTYALRSVEWHELCMFDSFLSPHVAGWEMKEVMHESEIETRDSETLWRSFDV